MGITQKDIAERLQLSRSLVAGVLNEHPGVFASPETRRRVLEAAREMNYRPHAAARALRSGKTMVVSLAILPDERERDDSRPSGGWDSLIETLVRSLGERDYKLQVEMFSSMEKTIGGLEEMTRSRACDAVVVCGIESVTKKIAPLLEEAKLPFVCKGYFENHPEWPQIDFDHIAIMRESVTHLARIGHDRIAFLGLDNDEVYARQLRVGFDLATRKVVASSPLMARVGIANEALNVMRQWLALPIAERPTAVVIGTNAYATWVECEIALAEVGLQAGDEADGFALCGLHPPLLPLLLGQAHGFDQADFAHLAQSLCEQLLLPTLEGKTLDTTIVRVMPPMAPLPSLELGSHNLFLPSSKTSSAVRQNLLS